MAKVYSVKTDSGSSELPITNGFYYTDVMNKGHETGTFAVAFYDSSGAIVTPTAGTITPEMELIEGRWGAPGVGDTVIPASSVSDAVGESVPVFNGPASRGRIELAGIAGAGIAYAKAEFWRD